MQLHRCQLKLNKTPFNILIANRKHNFFENEDEDEEIQFQLVLIIIKSRTETPESDDERIFDAF